MPELLWKSYIDFEVAEGGYDRDRSRVRNLYERLIEKTGHVKVWISWATFEGSALKAPAEEDEEEATEEDEGLPGDLEKAREVFERGYNELKKKGLKDEVCLFSADCLLVRTDRSHILHSEWCFWKVGRSSKKKMELQRR